MSDAKPGIFSAPYAAVTIANLAVISLGAFDALAVIAALPSIAEDLGDVALLPWVVTSYLGSSAVAVIVAGPIIDAVGVRRTFQVMGMWFLLTSVAVALAPTLGWVLVARLAQGLGGGLMFAVAIAAVGIAFPHDLRPAAFAANEAVFAAMGVGSPAIAAILLEFSSWRLIFWIKVPLTALALLAGWNALPGKQADARRLHIDYVGVVLMTAMVFGLLFGLGQVGINWSLSIGGLALAAVGFTIYWTHAARHENPVLERQHLTRAPLRWIHLAAGLVLAGGVAVDNYVPLYLQVSRGRSAGFAAFSVLFIAVGWTAGSFVYARLLRSWPEPSVIVFGAACLLPATAFTAAMVLWVAPLVVVFASMFAMGIGIGLASTAALTMVQRSADIEELGRVNAAHQFLRVLAISVGVALGGAVLLAIVDGQIGDVEVVRSVLEGEGHGAVDSVTDVAEATGDAVSDGLVGVLVTSAVLGMGCLAAALGLKRTTARELHGSGG